MSEQEKINYERIAKAIDYIKTNFKDQPSLDDVAEHVHLSSFHFQRLFTDWAGVSPKKFMQYISIEYAKGLLNDEQSTLIEAVHETGLSGTGRLHDLFINIEGMTPGEFKNGGASLVINYHFFESPFGGLFVASTPKGICHISFDESETDGLLNVKNRFPNASYKNVTDQFQSDALLVFQNDLSQLSQIKLHLQGTDFQIKVWEALLKIPMGNLTSYGSIAQIVDKPNASRAVGTAIGKNPIAFLIPCHRVIQTSGNFGGYMWGNTRKTAIIGWEASKIRA